MNRQHAKQILNILLLCLLSSVFLLSCDKSGNEPGGGDPVSKFKPSDFKLTILKKEAGQVSYRIEFEVTNLKNEAYGDQHEDGNYYIRFKVKTTDGAEYQSQASVKDISANGSSSDFSTIDFPNGKTVNESTLNYEFYE
ncbi:hypothetical protein DBR32_12655 [Taibaiella sp. KBW10]|uniref:hypothetical protein n=1 Tax=Taibaiella sp. KBW10 TaxID=2153357 RepID=UPI000F596994|nr:hypothetical protein [Taibaiella sp. KBW10]RQO30412.1 hypothetical protein DBR32_12655 [Taibaiella sp. KBW10]